MTSLDSGSSKAKNFSKWCSSSALHVSFTCHLFISLLGKFLRSPTKVPILVFLDANKMLAEPYNTRWKTFLLYYIQEIFKNDSFTRAEYMVICDFIKEMQEFAANYAEAAPHHIQEAEEKAPKETWKSPISLQEWMERDFERRWGRSGQ